MPARRWGRLTFDVRGPGDSSAKMAAMLDGFEPAGAGTYPRSYELKAAIGHDGLPRDSRFDLFWDGDLLHADLDDVTAADVMLHHLRRVALDENPDTLHVHAAALAADRRALLLVGASGVGKTTLAAAAVLRGWVYATDELVALDADGSLLGFPKPITVKSEALVPVGPLPTTGPELEVGWARMLLPLTTSPGIDGSSRLVIAVVCHDSTAPTAREARTRAETVAALLENALDAERLGRRALRIAAVVASRADCVWLRAGGPDEAVVALEEVADREQPEPSAIRMVDPTRPNGGLGRSADVFSVIIDERAVIYRPATGLVMVLDPTASVVWEQLDGCTDRGSLARALQARFGGPRETIAKDCDVLLDELMSRGMVRCEGA